MPVVIIPQIVVEKLQNGADLMPQEVINIMPSHAIQFPIPLNALVCIIADNEYVEPKSMVVGRMNTSSSEIERTKKIKAAVILHTYGDALCKKGGNLKLPTELSWIGPELPTQSAAQISTTGTFARV